MCYPSRDPADTRNKKVERQSRRVGGRWMTKEIDGHGRKGKQRERLGREPAGVCLVRPFSVPSLPLIFFMSSSLRKETAPRIHTKQVDRKKAA